MGSKVLSLIPWFCRQERSLLSQPISWRFRLFVSCMESLRLEQTFRTKSKQGEQNRLHSIPAADMNCNVPLLNSGKCLEQGLIPTMENDSSTQVSPDPQRHQQNPPLLPPQCPGGCFPDNGNAAGLAAVIWGHGNASTMRGFVSFTL